MMIQNIMKMLLEVIKKWDMKAYGNGYYDAVNDKHNIGVSDTTCVGSMQRRRILSAKKTIKSHRL